MSLSKCSPMPGTTNLGRMARIILGPCTDILRDVLANEISPSDLKERVESYNAAKRKPSISKEQKQLVDGEDYTKFDITLLYSLLRNICTFTQHENRWGNIPSLTDRSVSANIERIRLIRNEYYGHGRYFYIPNSDFEDKWNYIFQIVKELEKYIGTSRDYQRAIAELRHCNMDLEVEDNCIQQLTNDVTGLIDELKEMKTSPIPCNVREIYECDILEWKKDDKAYFETHNFPAMLQRVKKQPFVTFVGSPGSGKSATVHHIALKLKEEGYDILPIKDIKTIEKYRDPTNPQVFVMEDIFGRVEFEENVFKKVINHRERLIKPVITKTKILMTCRETVFKNEELSNTVFDNTENIIHMHSPEFTLTEQDKNNLLAKCNIDKHMLPPSNVSKTSNMLPFLCAQFSKENIFRNCGPRFFIEPVLCILQLLDEMEKENKTQYASLALLMANQNHLSKEDLENDNHDHKDFHDVKTNVFKKIKFEKEKNCFEIIDALEAMDGRYTKNRNCTFSFVHNLMFDIFAYHFGRQYPEIILKYLSSEYIADHIKVDTVVLREKERERQSENTKVSTDIHGDTAFEREGFVDLHIPLQESYYGLFAERLYSDIKNGKFKSVFRNEALKHPAAAQAFIRIIEGKSYTELYSVFLSEMRDISKIQTYKESCNFLYEFTPSETIRFTETISFCKRIICLVIYFGHHLILKSIIDQISKKSKDINNIFQVKTKRKFSFFKKKNSNSASESAKENHKRIIRERLLAEQYRLLCIGCYSGDPNTVQILLKHIDEDALNITGKEDVRLFWKDLNLKSMPLVIASKHGFLEIVKELIKEGASVNNNDGSNTPLTAACKNGYLDIVKELIIGKADINLTLNEYTPLAAACENGHIDIVIELIKAEAGININAENAPITLASKNGHSSIVQALLEHNADVNPADNQQTPLSAACRYGHLTIAQQLIEAGAHVNSKNKYQTPLTSACNIGNQAIIKVLIESGADVNLQNQSNTPLTILCQCGFLDLVKVLINAKADVNLSDGSNTPLTAACKWGHLSIVKELLKGEEVRVDLGNGTKTPLTEACELGHLDIIKELIRVGADVNLLYRSKLPLTIACHRGYFDIVACLIKSGACVNLSDKDDTPLTVACKEGHLSIAQLLIQAGADVNLDKRNVTPLTAACESENLSLVEHLIGAGAIVNLCCGSKTPLTAACAGNNLMIVEHLIKNGADVNLTDEYSTPLIIACQNKESSFVKVLINAGSEVNLGDRKKNTPLQVACLKERGSIIDELITAGASAIFNDEEEKFLIYACQNRYLKFVQLLIKAGENVNKIYGDKTPLIAAIDCCHLDIVKELIRAGAKVDQCYQNRTPLTYACKRKPLKIVKELINAKANVNLSNGIKTPLTIASHDGSLDIVKELIKAGAVVNLRDTKETPLTAACKQGHSDVAKELMKSGADINIGDEITSPLASICRQAVCFDPPSYLCKGKILCFIAELIQNGTDINKITQKEELLTNACYFECLSLIKEMIKAGLSVNESDGIHTPLTVACSTGRINVVEVLIEAGADVNLKDTDSTPLTAACRNHEFDIVDKLLKAGADVDASNENNVLLLSACYYGSLSVVKGLIKLGANINQGDEYYTPLTAASVFGHVNVVKELIKAGAYVNQNNGYGKTPLTVAMDSGHFELVKVLINAGADIHLNDEILAHLIQLFAKRKSENYYEETNIKAKY